MLDRNRFVRIHRSAIVNIERIARIEPFAKESRVAILHGWFPASSEPRRLRAAARSHGRFVCTWLTTERSYRAVTARERCF